MTSFDAIKLQVGARLQIMLKRGSRQLIYYTSLIGYVSGEYLLMKIPFEHGLSVPMRAGEHVTLRVFSGMNVFAFVCNVESVFLSPRFYMHLSFPAEIKVTALRKAIRVKVDLPVQIKDASGIITDISLDGAQITANSTLGEAGAKIALSFRFQIKPTNQEVLIETSATIRSVRELPAAEKGVPPRFSHGVLFDDIDPTNQVMLQNLVYESLLGLKAGLD